MNEEICAIPRAMWYDNDLKPATKQVASSRLALLQPLPSGDPLAGILDPQVPVVFVNVPWAGGADGPRTNRREAELVRDIVLRYQQAGLSLESLGVIAPFRAQVSTIRREIEAAMAPDKAAAIRKMVDTVDRFQGQQREAIIISLATYGDFVHELLQDERRLNVAITRAKHKLIIVGDRAVLGRIRPTTVSLSAAWHAICLAQGDKSSRCLSN